MTSIRDNTEAGRFELDVQGQTVFADYRRTPGLLIIDYVEAPPSLRGTGAAGQLMEGVAAEARRDGVRIVPICSYAAAWLRRHREHADLLA